MTHKFTKSGIPTPITFDSSKPPNALGARTAAPARLLMSSLRRPEHPRLARRADSSCRHRLAWSSPQTPEKTIDVHICPRIGR